MTITTAAARGLRRQPWTASRSRRSSGPVGRPPRWSRCSRSRPGRRLHREQVIEALWPGASVEAAGPRLHKAAHYARRALGGDGSVAPAAQRHGRPGCRTVTSASTSTRSATTRSGRSRTGTVGCSADRALDRVRRTAAPRGRLRGVGRGGARRGADPARRPAPPGRALGRRPRGGPDRRGGPPGPDPGPRRPGRRTRGAAAVRASRPCAAARARHHAEPGGRAAARPPARVRRAAPTSPSQGVRLVGRRSVGDQVRDGDGTGRGPARARTLLLLRTARGRQDRRARVWPRRWPVNATGAPAAAPPRPSRDRGPTRRCSRRSASCAASTRPCSTGSTTASGSRSSARSPGETSAGRASPATSDCSSRSPS